MPDNNSKPILPPPINPRTVEFLLAALDMFERASREALEKQNKCR